MMWVLHRATSPLSMRMLVLAVPPRVEHPPAHRYALPLKTFSGSRDLFHSTLGAHALGVQEHGRVTKATPWADGDMLGIDVPLGLGAVQVGVRLAVSVPNNLYFGVGVAAGLGPLGPGLVDDSSIAHGSPQAAADEPAQFARPKNATA